MEKKKSLWPTCCEHSWAQEVVTRTVCSVWYTAKLYQDPWKGNARITESCSDMQVGDNIRSIQSSSELAWETASTTYLVKEISLWQEQGLPCEGSREVCNGKWMAIKAEGEWRERDERGNGRNWRGKGKGLESTLGEWMGEGRQSRNTICREGMHGNAGSRCSNDTNPDSVPTGLGDWKGLLQLYKTRSVATSPKTIMILLF